MPPTKHEHAAHLADAVEAELRRLGVWEASPPTREKAVSGGAFGSHSVAFTQWLQVVLVPRLREVVRSGEALPASSMVGVMAMRELDGWDEGDELRRLLSELDLLVEVPDVAAFLAKRREYAASDFAHAERLVGEGNHAAALRLLDSAIRWDETSPNLLNYTGWHLWKRMPDEPRERALSLFERAAKVLPEEDLPLVNLGDLAHEMGHAERAIPTLVEAVRRSPDAWKRRNELGWIYLEAKHPELALPELEAAVRLTGNGTGAPHLNLAHALFRLDRHAEAYDAVLCAFMATGGPHDRALAYALLSDVDFHAGRLARSVGDLRRAIFVEEAAAGKRLTVYAPLLLDREEAARAAGVYVPDEATERAWLREDVGGGREVGMLQEPPAAMKIPAFLALAVQALELLQRASPVPLAVVRALSAMLEAARARRLPGSLSGSSLRFDAAAIADDAARPLAAEVGAAWHGVHRLLYARQLIVHETVSPPGPLRDLVIARAAWRYDDALAVLSRLRQEQPAVVAGLSGMIQGLAEDATADGNVAAAEALRGHLVP